MKIKKPIFIVGIGRSGSTAFYDLFSKHPNVAWLSGLCNKYPDKPSRNRLLMKGIDYFIIGEFLRRKYGPGECYAFWEHISKGFSEPCRDLLAQDVTVKTKKRIQDAMSAMITEKRNRLSVKITGWPRICFLKEIFNDAIFIHLIRDGRAVVNSIINVDFWRGWMGPQRWRWGELTSTQKKEWSTYGHSFIALAAIQWKMLMDAMEKAKNITNKNDIIDVRYEDLCSDPFEVFKKIAAFCDLEWPSSFEDSVSRYAVSNMNYKWEEELTTEQKRILEDILKDYLKRYGYT